MMPTLPWSSTPTVAVRRGPSTGTPKNSRASSTNAPTTRNPPPCYPDWRLTCVYVDPKHRGQVLARYAIEGALQLIGEAGGGLVEAISETTAGRTAQGRFLFTATAETLQDLGFTPIRQVGKHAWILSLVIPATH